MLSTVRPVDERRVIQIGDETCAPKANPLHDPLARAVVGVALGDEAEGSEALNGERHHCYSCLGGQGLMAPRTNG